MYQLSIFGLQRGNYSLQDGLDSVITILELVDYHRFTHGRKCLRHIRCYTITPVHACAVG